MTTETLSISILGVTVPMVVTAGWTVFIFLKELEKYREQ
jgi:hypothetical protein